MNESSEAGARQRILHAPLLYALPIALMGGLYLLCFYPAIMTFDSLYQWQQTITGHYTDWHPVLSTLLIGMARFFWDSPASMVLLQIIALSLVAGWGLKVMEELGAPRISVWMACLLFAISPLNGAFVVTIWKDIPYGIALLALTILVARIVTSDGQWLAGKLNCVVLGVVLTFCMLLRHNGIAAAFGTPILLLAGYRRYWRALLGALALCAAITVIFKGPVFYALKVKPAISEDGCSLRYYGMMTQIAAHIAAQTPLTSKEREYLNRIKPLEPAWYYHKYYDFPISQQNKFNWSVILEHPAQFLRCYAALTLRRPLVNLRHCLNRAQSIWRPCLTEESLKKGAVFNIGVGALPDNQWRYITPPDSVPEIEINLPEITQSPKLPRLSNILARWLIDSQSGRWNIWQSSNYLYLFLLGTAWAAWRARNAKIVFLVAPLLLHTALLIIFIPGMQSRYQYPVFLIAHVFWAGLFFGRFPAKRLSGESL